MDPWKAAEVELARAEAQTRTSRPATDTAAKAIGVYLRAPSVMAAAFCAVLSGVWWWLAPPVGAWAAVGGLAVLVGWPVLEWSAHRWVLHLVPRQWGRWRLDPAFARRHRMHHANPAFFPYVFLPVGVVLGAWAVLAGAGWCLGVAPGAIAAFLAAMSVATLCYEWMHFMAHADFTPPGRWLKRVGERHRLHHYRNEQRWYAFTVPAVDDWMGTGGSARAVPRSPTTRFVAGDVPSGPGAG